MKTNYILTIKAEDRPGLLHLVTGLINKRQIPLISLSAATTDVHTIVLITAEVIAAGGVLTTLALKLANIVEVFAVEVRQADKLLCLRAAYFKMAKEFLESPQVRVLEKYSAVIVNYSADAVLVAKYGTDLAIRRFYNELEGPHLMGFSQSGLIADSGLIGHEKEDESSVISLAA